MSVIWSDGGEGAILDTGPSRSRREFQLLKMENEEDLVIFLLYLRKVHFFYRTVSRSLDFNNFN